MPTTKDKLEFTHAMARHTKATVRQCEALMRYAATLQRLAEDDCNVATDGYGLARRADKRLRIKQKVMDLCKETIRGEGETAIAPVPIFSSDPRGAVLKIRVPSGWSNDFGREGIVVPAKTGKRKGRK